MGEEQPWYADVRALYPNERESERAIQEIKLARLYTTHFNHGTDGHSRLVLIAKLAQLLDTAQTGMYPP